MEQLLEEVIDKTFRVKCHHGCEHAGDGVLFKFSQGKRKGQVKVTEIGLDRRNELGLNCAARMGSSDNWVLLKQNGEVKPYTFAIHRLPRNQYEIYIAGQDAAVDYPLEEVDQRYEDEDFYQRRPSLKKARRGGGDEHCAHSRSRSRSRSRSLTRSEGSYEGSYSYDEDELSN